MKKILLFTTITVLFSCNGSDEIAPINDGTEEVNPEEDKNLKLLSITTYGADNSQLEYRVEYKYIDDKLFEIRQSADSASSFNVRQFHYDSTGNTIYITHFDFDGNITAYETFFIENQKIVSADFKILEFIERAEYIYAEGNISERKIYTGNNHKISSIGNFTYDSNNNVLNEAIKSNEENEFILTQEAFFVYDDKKNPLNLVYTESLKKVLFIGKNNILSESRTFYGNPTSGKYEYIYNEKGYPMSVKVYRDGLHISNQYYVYAKN